MDRWVWLAAYVAYCVGGESPRGETETFNLRGVNAPPVVDEGFKANREGLARTSGSGDSLLPAAALTVDFPPGSFRLNSEAAGSWVALGDHMVADAEGSELFRVTGDLALCRRVCSHYVGCKSFAFCSGACDLKGGVVNASSPGHYNDYCTTFFFDPNARNVPDPTSDDDIPDRCYKFSSTLSVGKEQVYPGSPDSEINGQVSLLLCTNGTVSGDLILDDVYSEVIAFSLNVCDGVSDDSSSCQGTPVINFCGNNDDALIDDRAPYSEPCGALDITDLASGNMGSTTIGVQGVLIDAGAPTDMTLAQRVYDVSENDGSYYVVAHTLASYTHWHPKHPGVCRGQLLPATTTKSNTPDAVVSTTSAF